jgi:hypothetical protein
MVVDVDVTTVNVVSTGMTPEFGSEESLIRDEELICSGS